MKPVVGKSVASISFDGKKKRKKKAVVLASKAGVKIDDECVQVDPHNSYSRDSAL